MGYINIHTHSPMPNRNISVRSYQPGELEELDVSENTHRSAGIHPWYIENVDKSFNQLIEALEEDSLLLIGECGLDHVWGASQDLQESVFRKHIELSEKYEKPLLIHCVKAYNEVIAIFKEMQPKQTWIIHGFSGSQQLMEQLLDLGFYLSFGKAITNVKSKAYEVFKDVPLDRIFLETDDSPLNIRKIYEKAAEIKQIDVTELETCLVENFNKLFG